MSKIYYCAVIIFCLLMTACASQKTPEPTNTAFNSLGDMYASSGRLDEAERYYMRANLLNKLADVQVQQGKYSEAVNTYEKMLQQHPSNKVRYRLARAALSAGDTQTAFNQYEILLNANHKDYQALNGLGVLLDHMSHYTKAQACYRAGLRYSPDKTRASILNNLGVSYALSGDIQDAKRYLELSNQFSSIERSANNMEFIKKTYKEIRNPSLRRAQLSKELLLKIKITNLLLKNNAVSLARKQC